MPKIFILLSTYNGEKYLKEQIESILNQDEVEVSLVIRDDGSTDDTIKIINSFNSEKIKLIAGQNVGWKKSFFSLLRIIGVDAKAFYAFADQDDIWMPDKMISAVRMIADTEIPTAYHSNVSIVDENGTFLANRFTDTFEPNTKLPYAFFDSLALGCTMVFNSELLAVAKKHIPEVDTQHDAYVFALGYLLGQVVYDRNPHIKYRRHGSATSGFSKISNSGQPSILARYKKYKKGPKNSFSIRAQEILRGYKDEVREDDVKIIKVVANYRGNWYDKFLLLCSPKLKATGLRRTLELKYRALNNTL